MSDGPGELKYLKAVEETLKSIKGFVKEGIDNQVHNHGHLKHIEGSLTSIEQGINTIIEGQNTLIEGQDLTNGVLGVISATLAEINEKTVAAKDIVADGVEVKVNPKE